MKTLNYNLTNDTTIKAMNAVDSVGSDPIMTVANRAANQAEFTLYYQSEDYAKAGNTSKIYYILNKFLIDAGRTLTLDKTDFGFGNEGYDLWMSVDAANQELDVIINI
jgi:hypothetical protein